MDLVSSCGVCESQRGGECDGFVALVVMLHVASKFGPVIMA